MSRPVILDLFCGAGGAAQGYHEAGFDVIGVDINPQPRYPFRFIQGDALDVLAGWDLMPPFDAIHASPTCQTRSRATAWRGRREDHPDLLTPTLRALDRLSVPWVVENVPEASWDGTMLSDYLLCGTQFGLNVRRHRVFQRRNWDGFDLLPPCQCYRNPRLLPFEHKGERAFADAMGCDWMNKYEARQAIPPAFTRFIGEQLLAHLAADPRPGPGPKPAGPTHPTPTHPPSAPPSPSPVPAKTSHLVPACSASATSTEAASSNPVAGTGGLRPNWGVRPEPAT
jgi:hypothetical protein